MARIESKGREWFVSWGEVEGNEVYKFLNSQGLEVKYANMWRGVVRITLANASDEHQSPTDMIGGDFVEFVDRYPSVPWDTLCVNFSNSAFLRKGVGVTQKVLNEIEGAKSILESLPPESVLPGVGIISVSKSNSGYLVSLTSARTYADDNQTYTLESRWYFDPELREYSYQDNVSARNPNQEFNEAVIQLEGESSYFRSLKFLSLLRVLNGTSDQLESLRNRLIPRQQESDFEMVRDRLFPADTILKKLPHSTVVAEQRFSSIEMLCEQLKTWNIPYQVIRFNRGKQNVRSFDDCVDPKEREVQIAVIDKKGQRHFILGFHEELSSGACFIFETLVEMNDDGKKYLTARDRSRQRRVWGSVEIDLSPVVELEVVLPSQIRYPIDLSDIHQNTIKIEEYELRIHPSLFRQLEIVKRRYDEFRSDGHNICVMAVMELPDSDGFPPKIVNLETVSEPTPIFKFESDPMND